LAEISSTAENKSAEANGICDIIIVVSRSLHCNIGKNKLLQCTEVRFASFLSGRFTSMEVINPPESKLAKRTSVQCIEQDIL
jgi:hypothetical protein